MATKSTKRLDRKDWISAAIDKLAREGIESVRVEPLARSLGVTKGSFYWHFKDRRALLDAVLDHWERVGTLDVIDFIEASGGSVENRLLKLCDKAGAELGIEIEVALRNWAQHDVLAAEAVARVDGKRMGLLRQIFSEACPTPEEAEARSWLFYSLFSAEVLIADSARQSSRGDLIRKCVEVLARPARTSEPILRFWQRTFKGMSKPFSLNCESNAADRRSKFIGR